MNASLLLAGVVIVGLLIALFSVVAIVGTVRGRKRD
jgi:hypothetical protein